MKTDDEELIRKRAYELWERAGKPEGDSIKHWLEAAEELRLRTPTGEGASEHPGLPAGMVDPAVIAEAKKARKVTVRKQAGAAQAAKKGAASKPTGDRKRKKTEGD